MGSMPKTASERDVYKRQLAPRLGIVGLYGLVADLVQSKGVGGGNVFVVTPVQALDELNLDVLSHVEALLRCV